MKDIYRKSLIEKMSNPEQLDKTVRITSSYSWIALIGIAAIIAAAVLWAVFGTLPETISAPGVIVPTENVYAVYAESTGVVSEIKTASGKFSEGDEIITVSNGSGKETPVKAEESGVLSQLLVEAGAFVYRGQEIARYTPEIEDKAVVVCYVPVEQAQKLKPGMKAQLAPVSSDGRKDGHMEGEIIRVGSYAAGMSSMPFVLGGNDNQLTQAFAQNGAVTEVVFRLKTDSASSNGFFWTNERGKKLALPDGTIVTATIITSESAPISKLIGNIGGEN